MLMSALLWLIASPLSSGSWLYQRARRISAKKNAGLTIAISGDASPLGQQKLKDAKIALATRIAPRPLR